MATETGLTFVAALAMSVLLTFAVRKFALSHGVIDVPNERSSHQTPTPRGGGVSIVVAATMALTVLASLGALQLDVYIALAVGGGAVAVVGFFDDRHRLSVGIRFAVHIAAAIWALVWLGGLAPLRIGSHIVTFGWSGYVLGVLAIVWVLNLFNFMDGIDGIAASEAVFVAGGGALLAAVAGLSGGVLAATLVFGAACGGFLFWNWPPAKIFMGDVGSGYIGYVIVVLAMAAARQDPSAPCAWLILGGVFFIDATVTLLRRVARGERVQQAHRSHAYQWLARRWRSHRRVTLATMAVNVFWLLPCALLATVLPAHASWILLGAFAPLTVLAVLAGSGRPEPPGT